MLVRSLDQFSDLFWGPWGRVRLGDDLDRWLGTSKDRETQLPPINVWVNELGVIATAELPGLDAQNIEINIEGKVLTIRGEQAGEKADDDASYRRRERREGPFSRSVELPFEVETKQVQARYERGVLEIVLPRTGKELPRKIAITSA